MWRHSVFVFRILLFFPTLQWHNLRRILNLTSREEVTAFPIRARDCIQASEECCVMKSCWEHFLSKETHFQQNQEICFQSFWTFQRVHSKQSMKHAESRGLCFLFVNATEHMQLRVRLGYNSRPLLVLWFFFLFFAFCRRTYTRIDVHLAGQWRRFDGGLLSCQILCGFIYLNTQLFLCTLLYFGIICHWKEISGEDVWKEQTLIVNILAQGETRVWRKVEEVRHNVYFCLKWPSASLLLEWLLVIVCVFAAALGRVSRRSQHSCIAASRQNLPREMVCVLAFWCANAFVNGKFLERLPSSLGRRLFRRRRKS